MGIALVKGEQIDLTKSNPGLRNIIIGVGWETHAHDIGHRYDLDTAAFLTDRMGKVTSEADFIFYNNLRHPSGAVVHLGDHIGEVIDGDNEQIKVHLDIIPTHIEKMTFTVTIHEALERGQHFGQIAHTYIRIVDETAGIELIRYDLTEAFPRETAIVIGELHYCEGEWRFNAIGNGHQGGLAELCNNFGIPINS